MTLIKNALIMAAGRGNRMRPLTDVIPKALAPYRESTLIEQSIGHLREHGLKVHVTVGHLGNLLSEVLIRKGLVDGIFNTSGHDNAWWIFNTLFSELDEPILLLTCDNITELHIDEIEAEYIKNGTPPCMIVPVPPLKSIDGDYVEIVDGRVTSISREKVTKAYASGIQVINPAAVNRAVEPTEQFGTVWSELMSHRLLGAANLYTHFWFSVDTLEQLTERNEK